MWNLTLQETWTYYASQGKYFECWKLLFVYCIFRFVELYQKNGFVISTNRWGFNLHTNAKKSHYICIRIATKFEWYFCISNATRKQSRQARRKYDNRRTSWAEASLFHRKLWNQMKNTFDLIPVRRICILFLLVRSFKFLQTIPLLLVVIWHNADV